MSLRQAVASLTFSTPGVGLHDVTPAVTAWVQAQGMNDGLLTLFLRHTSASLTIQENADPAVLADLADYFAQIAPLGAPQGPGRYRHDDEGPDDMPAHIRTALTQTSLSIPLISGRLALGTWQAIYLFEHRARPHRREVALHLLGQ